MTDRRALLASLGARADGSGLLTDFDGTLGSIVPDPSAAVLLPGAAGVLAALARRLGRVAVVSGRPLSFLAAAVGPPSGRMLLSGLYGMESAAAGPDGGWEITRHPDARAWEPVVHAVVGEALAAAPPGVIVEDKGVSLTVHWRTAPDREAWVRDWVEAAAGRTGLAVHPAKASAELRVPVARDKGTVVEELAAGLDVVCYMGDDVGDLPAAAAVHRRPPGSGWVVAVGGPETPPDLLAAADLVVDGPPGALELLTDLAAALP